MTKADFFRYCDTAETHDEEGKSYGPLSISVCRVRLPGIQLEDAVYLNGVWNQCSSVCVELYKPMPGNQHKNWQGCLTRLEAARKKFERWLDEWRQSAK